jgi:hypothetical protein
MRKLLLWASILTALSAGAFAQLASTTALVGNVVDSAGAAMAGVTVTAVNTGTSETYTTVTTTEGAYNIQFVKIGTYDISASKSGFSVLTKRGVLVQTDQIVRTDFTLKVGQVSEKIEVTAAAPPIATDEASVSEVINTRQTTDLPLNGRDPLKLAITAPGVLPGLKSPAGNPGGGEDFVAAGVREIQNSVSLDGVSIMNNLITTTTFRPSPDAVQEVHIQTGTYPAQYGGYMGLQMNLVTKTGTNDFHGALFEFLRNNYFDARGFFEKPGTPQAPFRQNQFGFQLGGPVWIPKLYNGRNKTFFMIDYEGLRQTQSIGSLDTVLTPLMRQGNFSEVSTPILNPLAPGNPPFSGNIIPSNLLAPQALKALKYMPLPNQPGLSLNYAVNVPNSNNTNQTIGRIDQSITQNARVFFRYAWENTTLVNGNTNPYNGYNQPVTDRNFVIGYTQVLSPSMVNDMRFGRQHTTIDSVNFFHTDALASAGTDLGIPGFTTDLSNSGLPNLSVTGFMAIGGQNMASSNWYQTDATWQGTDIFSWNHGAHNIMAGVEIRKLITMRTANNNPRGLFSFTNQFTGYSAADFMLGLPLQVTTPGALFPGGGEQYRDGFFVDDKWQVSSRLTLNFGLRYELPTVPHSTNGNGTILDPAQTHFIPTTVPQIIPYTNPTHNDWAPRFGFAYRAPAGFVFRGGYGIYYNPNQLNTYTLATTNPPFATIFTYNSTQGALLSLSNPTPASAQGALPKPNAFTINPDLPTAYMNQWSFDVAHGLWHNAGFDLEYLGSHGLHLDRSFYNNQPLPGPGNIDARRPNQNFRQIRTIQNDEISNYNGLSAVLRQNFSHGFTALISYTWSHSQDVSTDSNGGGAPMDPYNWRRDYANSNWDIRHRFVASYVYDLPWFRQSGNPVLKYALGNWQVNGITIIQSGLPFSVVVQGDPANMGQSVGSQRPNLVGDPQENCSGSNLSNCLNPAAFAAPANFTYGNLGRNTFRGPGFSNWDFSLFKNFPIRERARFQIRGEFFNVFNHPSFGNPGATLGTSTFGKIGGTAANYTPRQIQLAAKLTF